MTFSGAISAAARPEWEKLHAVGLTAREAAEARGVTAIAAYAWAKRAGKCWAPPAPRPDWENMHALGLTAAEAAARCGAQVGAARDWARRTGKCWASPAPAARPDWEDLHAQGLTAREAAAARGSTLAAARGWSSKTGKSWAVKRCAVPGPDLPALPPITDPREVDGVACVKLWRSVLLAQFTMIWANAAYDGRRGEPPSRRDVLDVISWFGSRDCALVCDYAGVDVGRARAAARACAVRLGVVA